MSTRFSLKDISRFSFVILICLFGMLLTYDGSDAHGYLQQTGAAPTAINASPTTANDPNASSPLYPPCPATDANGAQATVAIATNVPVSTLNSTDTAATAAAPTATGPGYLGIRLEVVENCGLRVAEVLLANSAIIGQLQAGDVIVAVDGQPISSLPIEATGADSAASTVAAASASPTLVATVDISTTQNAGPVAMPTNPTPVGNDAATPIATTASTPTADVSSANGGDNAPLALAFFKVFENRQVGDVITLTVQRGGQQFDTLVTLGVMPADLSAAPVATIAPSEVSAPTATP